MRKRFSPRLWEEKTLRGLESVVLGLGYRVGVGGRSVREEDGSIASLRSCSPAVMLGGNESGGEGSGKGTIIGDVGEMRGIGAGWRRLVDCGLGVDVCSAFGKEGGRNDCKECYFNRA